MLYLRVVKRFFFLPKWASKVMSFVVPCGVFLEVFFLAATLDGGLIDARRSVLNNPNLRFNISITRSITPTDR